MHSCSRCNAEIEAAREKSGFRRQTKLRMRICSAKVRDISLGGSHTLHWWSRSGQLISVYCFVTDLLISLSFLVCNSEGLLYLLCLQHCMTSIMSIWWDSPNSPQFCCTEEVTQPTSGNILSHSTHSLALPLWVKQRINYLLTIYAVASQKPLEHSWCMRTLFWVSECSTREKKNHTCV